MDKLLDILNKGIEAKREGNYQLALGYYSQAQKMDPIDMRSYGNSMKVLIGTEQYEQAFRQLLIGLHDQMVENNFSKDPIAENVYQKFYKRFHWTHSELIVSHVFEPLLLYIGLEKNAALKDLIYFADNLTFYMGHCYIGELITQDPGILLKFGTQSNYFDNLNKKVLGRPSGQIFRDTPQEGYFLSIGFIYAHMNLKFALKTKQDIVNYYLNPKTEIRKDIWNYRNFLQSNR